MKDGQVRDKSPKKVCEIERNNWKPSNPGKHGHNKTIGKVPEYKPNPMKFLTRKSKVEGEEEEETKRPFRKTHAFKSRPSPSVACNLRNIKSAFPTVFRKWVWARINNSEQLILLTLNAQSRVKPNHKTVFCQI